MFIVDYKYQKRRRRRRRKRTTRRRRRRRSGRDIPDRAGGRETVGAVAALVMRFDFRIYTHTRNAAICNCDSIPMLFSR